MDDNLIPDETVFLGEKEAKSQQSFDDEFRELAAKKFLEDDDLEVSGDSLIVIERSGYISVQVSRQGSDSKS